MSRRAESPGARLRRVIVPGTSGGLYTLLCGTLGFGAVVYAYIASFHTGKPMPLMTEALLTASVALLGVHTTRGILADRENAKNGVAPVPVEPTTPPTMPLPDLPPSK
ncbi:hypothetical protein [Deinococcus apachensis]|uniref:hypothetical protein n=1 Tax=Deinococcus apachensis TaxID=309886 RepID=UPI00036A80F2|nr:hypothetical protein [Deinococcus apachensis]